MIQNSREKYTREEFFLPIYFLIQCKSKAAFRPF